MKEWLASTPAWLEIRTINQPVDISPATLDAGEREAVQLAEELGASLLIIDEKPGRAAAEARNLKVTGTLGVIGLAAERRLLDFVETLSHLQQTNFHISPVLIKELSDLYGTGKTDEE